MNRSSTWPVWVVSREARAARATLALCIVAFAMVGAAALSAGPRGIWLELILSAGFLLWAGAQWTCVERRLRAESTFRRDVERDIDALAQSSSPE